MLDALRRGSTGWVAKILFAVLVMSFAIWGVADVFTGLRPRLARQGRRAGVSASRTSSASSRTSSRSSRGSPGGASPWTRHAQQGSTTASSRSSWPGRRSSSTPTDLDLALSDEALVEELKDDPAFKGPDGKFSKLTFENVLNQMGLSERGFLKLRRRDEVREQLTDALINSVAVPDTMIDLVNGWREEKRVAEFFTIDQEKAVTVPEPDEAKLKETYETNKGEFASPEFRKLAVLALSVDSLKGKMDVSDAEIAASYEESKKDYNTPERRRVQQIAFKDKEAAEAAKAALKDGKTFGEVAKEAGAKDADIDLGLISKAQLIDPKIADAAFSLEKEQVSDVVEGRFATVLLRVSDIQPAITRTLADVKDQVRDKLAIKKAREGAAGTARPGRGQARAPASLSRRSPMR